MTGLTYKHQIRFSKALANRPKVGKRDLISSLEVFPGSTSKCPSIKIDGFLTGAFFSVKVALILCSSI